MPDCKFVAMVITLKCHNISQRFMFWQLIIICLTCEKWELLNRKFSPSPDCALYYKLNEENISTTPKHTFFHVARTVPILHLKKNVPNTAR